MLVAVPSRNGTTIPDKVLSIDGAAAKSRARVFTQITHKGLRKPQHALVHLGNQNCAQSFDHQPADPISGPVEQAADLRPRIGQQLPSFGNGRIKARGKGLKVSRVGGA